MMPAEERRTPTLGEGGGKKPFMGPVLDVWTRKEGSGAGCVPCPMVADWWEREEKKEKDKMSAYYRTFFPFSSSTNLSWVPLSFYWEPVQAETLSAGAVHWVSQLPPVEA